MPQSVFVNENSKAVFTCPQCTRTKTSDVSKLLDQKKNAQIKVKCSCGHIFDVTLERRKFYRKKTILNGFFIKWNQEKKTYPMSVLNLSRSGLEFKTSISHTLNAGDYLMVEFRLDDKNKSLIKKKIVIKRIEKNNVGAEFCSQDEYDKVLGFYLFR